jgi:hypothetical protein
MSTKTKITDQTLLDELENSYLDPMYKDHFAQLIPDMGDKDRAQLMDLIKESHKAKEQKNSAEAEYQNDLKDLNAEYDQKISDKKKELTQYTLNEYRKLEAKQSEEETAKIESQITNI